jgi:hypothetical protein
VSKKPRGGGRKKNNETVTFHSFLEYLKRISCSRSKQCAILLRQPKTIPNSIAFIDWQELQGIARKPAVIMHRMWMDGSRFQWSKEAAAS